MLSNPFKHDALLLPVLYQTESIEFKNDTYLQNRFKKEIEIEIEEFWALAYDGYENVVEIALRILIPFSSTTLFECSFSTMLKIKNKHRNRVDPVPQMVISLSNIKPNIKQIVASKGNQISAMTTNT